MSRNMYIYIYIIIIIYIIIYILHRELIVWTAAILFLPGEVSEWDVFVTFWYVHTDGVFLHLRDGSINSGNIQNLQINL